MRLTDEVGLATERRLDHARADGFDLDRLRAAFITRTHADHEGGAGLWVEATGAQIAAHPVAAAFIHAGNEAGFNVTVERAAGGNPTDYCLQPVANVRSLADGEDVRIGTLPLSVRPQRRRRVLSGAWSRSNVSLYRRHALLRR
jgi:glyoxylase-like metal-dependent hydrolase (beta-lactamase superfamily II)